MDSNPKEIENDLMEFQTLRTLGRNMAWLIKCIKSGKKDGIEFPELEPLILEDENLKKINVIYNFVNLDFV